MRHNISEIIPTHGLKRFAHELIEGALTSTEMKCMRGKRNVRRVDKTGNGITRERWSITNINLHGEITGQTTWPTLHVGVP